MKQLRIIRKIYRQDRRHLRFISHQVRRLPLWVWISLATASVFGTFLVIYIGTVHADTQGPLSASSTSDCIDDNTGTIGTVAWTSPGNAFSSNSVYATTSLGGPAISHYIKCTNFGFTVPTGSTINGIVVGVKRNTSRTTNGGAQDGAVRIVKGGGVDTNVADDRSTTTLYTTTDVYEDHGTGTDLWGNTWAVSDINASNFGVAFAAKRAGTGGANITVSVDHIRITVYYTPPAVAYNQASYRVFNNQDASSSVTFAKAWGHASGDEYGQGVVRTTDGGYAVVGYRNCGGLCGNDALVVKFDSSGNVLWQTAWNDSGIHQAYAIIQTFDGGYAVTGYTTAYGAGGDDVFLAKLSSSGAISWYKVWGGTGTDHGQALAETTNHNIVVTGYTTSFGAGNGDIFVLDYSSDGNGMNWNTVWGGATASEVAYSVAATSDGGCVVAGYTNSFGAGGSDVVVLKYDSTGTLSWNKTWGGTGTDQAYSIVTTSDGGYAVTGEENSFGAGGFDAFLLKYDSTGTLSWNKTWGGTGTDVGRSIVQTSDGGYAISGNTSSFGAGNDDVLIIKYDSSGNVVWNKTWGGMLVDDGFGLVQTPSGNYIVSGYTDSAGAVGGYDIFLARYDSSGVLSGCTTACSSPTATTSIPTATASTPSATTSIPTATTSTQTPTATTISGATTASLVTLAPTSIDVGSALAAQNTAATIPADDQPFRLRVDVNISTLNLAAGGASMKLQYALRSGTCDSAFSGETYADVTDVSTIRYYDNANAVNGLPLTTNANDPTDGANTLVRQTYQEKGSGTFTNQTAINTSQDGVWDFALKTHHALAGSHYCFRIVKSSGSLLDTYSSTAIPEIVIPTGAFTQGSYRFFQANQKVPTFAKYLAVSTITDSDTAYAVVQTSDGGYAVAGAYGKITTTCTPACIDTSQYWGALMKFDSSGTLSWQTALGNGVTNGGTDAYSLVQTSDGGYAVAGTTSDYGAGGSDAFLSKFTSSGALSWTKTLGGASTNEAANSVVQTSDGGYAIAGYTYTNIVGAGGYDVLVAKLDSTGTLVWNKTWGGSGDDIANSIIQTSDGGYAIAGYTYSYGAGYQDALVIKLTSSGTMSWNKTWGGSGSSESAKSIVQTSDGGYAITGQTNSFGAGGSDVFIVKYDSSGNVTWSSVWGGSGDDIANSIIQTSDGGYAIAGNSLSFTGANNSLLIARFDSSGNYTWGRIWDTLGTEGFSIIQTSDGGYAIAGLYESVEFLLLKTDGGGNINGCSGTTCAIPDSPVATTPSGLTSSPSVTLGTPAFTITSPGAGTTISLVTTTVTPLGYSASVGSALTAQNHAYDALNLGTQFRLRVNVGIGAGGVASSGQSFKLQYSVRGSDLSCDTSFTGESYADVTTTTPIYYYNDANNASGDGVSWNANDPKDGTNTLVQQTYQEANNFSNSNSIPIYTSQSGVWEFALAIQSGTMIGTDYCVRVVKSDGTLLDTYSNIVDIAYGPSMINLLRQEAWWNRSGVRQNFFIKGQ